MPPDLEGSEGADGPHQTAAQPTTNGNHHEADRPNTTAPQQSWPQESHCDLGLVDDAGVVGADT